MCKSPRVCSPEPEKPRGPVVAACRACEHRPVETCRAAVAVTRPQGEQVVTSTHAGRKRFSYLSTVDSFSSQQRSVGGALVSRPWRFHGGSARLLRLLDGFSTAGPSPTRPSHSFRNHFQNQTASQIAANESGWFKCGFYLASLDGLR